MHLKFVKHKKKTYVYIMEYVLKEDRCDKNINRKIILSLGDLEKALIKIEIWKRYPTKIPQKILNVMKKEDLKKWVNSVMERNHIYKK